MLFLQLHSFAKMKVGAIMSLKSTPFLETLVVVPWSAVVTSYRGG